MSLMASTIPQGQHKLSPADFSWNTSTAYVTIVPTIYNSNNSSRKSNKDIYKHCIDAVSFAIKSYFIPVAVWNSSVI